MTARIAVALFALCSVATAQVAVKGKVVYTMAGDKITDGVVVVTDGKVAAVGPGATTPIPAGYKVLEAAVVTPGLVDARATLGLTGIYNTPHDSDQIEHSAPMQPELRAIDAYNAQEPLIEWVRSFGVTTVHTGHAPGELISGQTTIVKLRGRTIEEAVMVPTAMVAATLGAGAERPGGAPGTRGKSIAMLREELLKARDWQAKRDKAKADPGSVKPPAPGAGEKKDDKDKQPDPTERNIHMEMMADVAGGRTPLLVRCDRATDIAAALRLKQEFNLKLVLDSAAEAYVLTDQIKAAGVPVIIHPLMQRAVGEMENQAFTTPAKLRAAGIPVAFQSGYESYVPKVRVVLYEAAIAAANGLTFEQALAGCTIDAARLIGVGDRVGSLEVGKDGDVAMYDGDPFEYTSHCTGVVIEGKVVSDKVR
jgi:imidazolonepropionase-like amidohydrolase